MLHFLQRGKRKGIALLISFIMLFTMMPINTVVYANEVTGDESATTTWNFRGGQEEAYSSSVEGTTGEFAGIIINAETGKCIARDSGDTQVNTGTKLSVPVSGSAIIMVETSMENHDYTIDGVPADSDNYQYTYNGEEGFVEIEALNTVYLYEISTTPYDSKDVTPLDTPSTTMTLNADNIVAATYTSSFESGGFIITALSDKSVTVDANNNTADDGTSFTQRIKLGGTGAADYRSIKFSTLAAATVKVYAMSSSSSADRTLTLYDTSGAVGSVPAYGLEMVAGTMEIAQAGDYYLASPSSGVNVYGVVVTYAGTVTEPERPEWSTVVPPTINSVVQSDSNLVVSFELVTGTDGADKATVYMMDTTETVVDYVLVGTNSSTTTRTVEFTPEVSGIYTFYVVAERNDETIGKESDVSGAVSFVLPLTSPLIKGATNIGGGLVEVSWDEVKEAESYEISYKAQGDTNGTISETVTTASAVLSGLTIGVNYTIWVKAVRGTDESDLASIVITVTDDAQRPWFFSAFGQGVNTTNNYYSGSVSDGSVTVASEGGKGKLVPGSTDGLAYYYTAIDSDTENFILSAKVTVDAWTYSNGQEGFGLMTTDAVGINGDSSVFWNNSFMNNITKVEYYWDNVNQMVSDTGDKIVMKLGIGAQEKRGATAENIADGTILTNINELFHSSMTTLDTSCATKGAGTYNIVGNYQNAEAPTGSLDPDSLQTTFNLTIQRDNTGYRLSYTDEEGNTNTKLYYDIERDALTQIDKDNIYVGFFASRNAKITVTDINLTTSDPATDPPAEGRDITYVSPSYKILSTTAIGVANYEMNFYANADGILTLKDSENNVIINGEAVTANTYVKKNVLLTKGTNKFIVEFTPNADFRFSEYEYLSSYETATFEHVVIYQDYDLEVLYVSPSGGSSGIGSKSSPLDIYTAVKYVKPGQIIVLLGGTYSLTETVKIERGINGTEDNMIYMIADPNDTNPPVFDFGKACAGIIIAGDYWYMKGFDVTRSEDAQKGLQLSGDHCVLDEVNTYNNGNTGIQLSRYLTTDLYEDWPSNNLILNCTSYGNADKGYEDADGFAAKLTVGDGNVFDGCISYNNADDGWDLFAKPETGTIGQVVIQNCVAYGNGYLPDGTNAGNGNGFKLGGSSMAGNHKLINCVTFDNKAKGIDSNSGPNIQVYDCTTFNNDSYNVAFYTSDAVNTDYFAEGIISFRTTNKNIGENIKEKGTQDTNKIYKTTNYYWDSASQTANNSENNTVTEDWFVNLDTSTEITRNSDGTINLNGLLELTDKAPTDAGARMTGTASRDIIIPNETTPTSAPTPAPTSTPIYTPTSTPTPTPEITGEGKKLEISLQKDLEGNIDWTEAIKNIRNWINEKKINNEEESVSNQLLITIEMNGITKIPKELLETIQKQNAVVTLNLGNGISWTINGLDINEKDLQDIDLAVTLDTDYVPKAIIDNLLLSTDKQTHNSQISLVHDGDFHFRAELTIDLSETLEALLGSNSSILDTNNLIASIFYYNPKISALTLESFSMIDEEGRVRFRFNHASDYVIVYSNELIIDESTLAKITVDGVTTGKTSEKFLYAGGTVDRTEQLVTYVPDSIQEAVDEKLLDYKITYTSDDKSVVEVSKEGKITAISPGTATITTKLNIGEKFLEYKTKVTVEKAYIEFIKNASEIKLNEKVTFKVAVYGFNEEDIVWMTSKKNISTVARNSGKTSAVVTGKSAGTEKLYAKVLKEDGTYEYTKIAVTVIDPKKAETKPVETKEQIYVVKKGDSLWKIAQLYNCKVSDILALNDIKNANLIHIGEKILLPM